jgi:hypothetical protein
MHLDRSRASDKTNSLKAVYKQLEAERKKKDEAQSKEAAQRRTQQECILSGGVYLRHRLRKSSLSLEKSEIPEKHISLKTHII